MTEQMTVNIPLLREVVEWAEAEAAKPLIESQWMQDSWLSWPSDVAGNIASRLGDEDVICTSDIPDIAYAIESYCGTAYCIAGWIGQALDARYAITSQVGDVHVSTFAARALGLDPDEAECGLFAATNTIEDVRRIAEEIAGERL